MQEETFIKKTLTDLFTLLGEDSCDLAVSLDEERGVYNVLITGENLGHLIGSRGEISHSLQEVFNTICRKHNVDFKPVLFDIGGYKKVREEKLVELAKGVAKTTLDSDQPYKLRPMNSYERRIIHTEIAKFSNLVSYSIGEGKDRRVVVEKSEV